MAVTYTLAVTDKYSQTIFTRAGLASGTTTNIFCDYVRDSDELKDLSGKFDDSKLHDFEKVTYKVTDKSRPVNETYQFEICEEVEEKGEIIEKCHNETGQRVIYPYTTTETGRLVSATVGKHEQNIYDLKEIITTQQTEIDLLKSELCKLNPASKVC